MNKLTKEEAIKILKDTLYDEKTPTDYLEAVKMGREALKNQKIGHWKETTLANGRKGMKCSNCGCEPIEDVIYGYVYSDYCPNCGAKMKGENNGENNGS